MEKFPLILTRSIAFIFVVIFSDGIANAQQKDITHGNQQWVHYYNQTKLNDRWSLVLDGGYRWKDGVDKRTQYIVRAGMRYNFNSNISVATGYAHLGFYSEGEEINRIEHRIFQELLVKNKFEKFGLSHKYRIEERYFKQVVDGEIQSSHTFNYRLRYAIVAGIPLFGLSKTNPDSQFVLYIGDEIFINAGSEVVNNVFDQNRILISPTFQLSKALDIALTWSSMFAGTITASKYNSNSVFWLQIKHNLDLSNKKSKKDDQ